MTTINNLPLCITLGDPLGIGPEISVRTLDFLQQIIIIIQNVRMLKSLSKT